MEYQYLDSYKTRHINYQKLHDKIIRQFQESGESIDKMRTYDQILFVFDERSPSGRATRGVCDQLFNQTKNREGKTSINKMVWAYIENLETAKLCLIRDENKSAELMRKQGTISNRHSTFVYLQIIQISVYSRFTKDAILSYEIQPSNLPPVTLQNAINPVLNQQFTFRLQNTNEFSVVVMDSGIVIGQWTFPDEPGLRQGEYHRLVQSENLTLEAKIKYLPKDSSGQKVETMSQMRHVQGQRTNSKGAFENLVLFEPFLNNKANARLREAELKAAAPPRPQPQQRQSQQQDNSGVYSVMKSHVRNLYYLLVTLIICECLFAFESAVQFLDLLLAFYLIGLLMDRRIVNFQQKKLELTIVCIAFIVLLVKSFFGMASYPFYYISGVKVVMSVICAILEIAVVIALAICMNNASEIAPQRNIFFYKEQQIEEEPYVEPAPVVNTNQDDDQIWEDDREVYRSKY